jgi:hypothetical protein
VEFLSEKEGLVPFVTQSATEHVHAAYSSWLLLAGSVYPPAVFYGDPTIASGNIHIRMKGPPSGPEGTIAFWSGLKDGP